MINALFVYGSLAPGEKNQHFLKAIGGRWQPATTHGCVYSNGLPGTEGYPALTLTKPQNTCQGQLFTSRQLPRLWKLLDAFEGNSYIRTQIKVTLNDGRQRQAYCYVYNETINT